MRYGIDGRTLLCVGCYQKKYHGVKKDTPTAFTIKSPVIEKPKETMKVICFNCRYKFSILKGAVGARCPYCNKDKLVRDETTAERILEEAARDLDG